MTKKPKNLRVLTGITPSGTPHLGNYVGSMRPSIRASRQAGVQSFYFLADWHGLIKNKDPERLNQSTLQIAASWLAAGLDPEHVTFYRQSDIPEILELTWLLTCVTGKGLLNRAHAYKAMLDKNAQAGLDPDTDVNAGLFMYPVLMAADIIMFSAHQVPVGRDQIQHIEMARDMAASFNHSYGQALLTEPQALIDEHVATLPGLDGRKMSKSYNNTIALFGPADAMRRQIMSIVTDSRLPGEPKDAASSSIFEIYQAFASAEETRRFAQALSDGMAWAAAKEELFARIEQEIAPMRQRYEQFMQNPGQVEDILQHGARKARRIASPFLQQLRQTVGIQPLRAARQQKKQDKKTAKTASFKQYREKDGLFYFKLVSAQGQTVLQSRGLTGARDAGPIIQQLQTEGAKALEAAAPYLQDPPAQLSEALLQALRSLSEAQQE